MPHSKGNGQNSYVMTQSYVEQEPRHERSSRRATAADDEGALRLRSIKESASYNLPTLSDSKRVV